MNDRIKPYIPWVNIGLIFLALFLIQYLYYSVLSTRINNPPYFSFIYPVVMPTIEILRHITMETIRWFGGTEYAFIELVKTTAISAAGLITLFIVAPWFFAKGMLHRNSENQPSGFTWYAATMLIILGISIASLNGVRHTLNSAQQQAIHSNQMADQLRTYMTHVAFEASEWWMLPEELGGGNGSFIGGDGNPITLNRFGSYDPAHPEFSVSIGEAPSDSVLILNGAMLVETDEGETERSFTIEVTPMDASLFRFL